MTEEWHKECTNCHKTEKDFDDLQTAFAVVEGIEKKTGRHASKTICRLCIEKIEKQTIIVCPNCHGDGTKGNDYPKFGLYNFPTGQQFESTLCTQCKIDGSPMGVQIVSMERAEELKAEYKKKYGFELGTLRRKEKVAQ